MWLRAFVTQILSRGQALYNQRRFGEAHDVWEQGWLVEEGEGRRMFQGLIQVATGYFNVVVRGRHGGRLLDAGLENLAGIPDQLAGLALGEFCRAVALTLDEVRRWELGESPDFDVAIVPRLESGWPSAANPAVTGSGAPDPQPRPRPGRRRG